MNNLDSKEILAQNENAPSGFRKLVGKQDLNNPYNKLIMNFLFECHILSHGYSHEKSFINTGKPSLFLIKRCLFPTIITNLWIITNSYEK